MHFNGSGTAVRDTNWQADAAANVPISAPEMDLEFNGVATCLSDCVTRDGQSPPTANLPMASFGLTGMLQGSNSADAATIDQIFTVRNLIRNGGFQVAQRGTSFSSPVTNTVTLDGWRVVFSGGTSGTYTIAQSDTISSGGIVGPRAAPVASQYGLQWNQTVAGTATSAFIEQRIPNVRNLNYSLGFTLYGSYAWLSLIVAAGDKIEIGTNYGTGGAPSSPDTWLSTTFGASPWGGLTYRTFACTVGSMAAKTFGSNNDDYLFVRIYRPSGTTTTFNNTVSGVVLTQVPSTYAGNGGLVTYPYRSYDEDLALCQRFYEKSYDDTVAVGAVSTAGQQAWTSRAADQLDRVFVSFRVKKWKTPVCTIYSPNTGTASKFFDVTGAADIAGSTANPGLGGFLVFPTANTVANHANTFHWGADIEP